RAHRGRAHRAAAPQTGRRRRAPAVRADRPRGRLPDGHWDMTRQPGLAARLLAAQLLAIAAGAVTFVLVALAAGPPLFSTHIREALGTVPPAVSRHLDDAFATAAGVSIGVGTAAALITAAAAAGVAAGDYTARVTPPGLGPELDTLTGTFNAMANALQTTEATRCSLL